MHWGEENYRIPEIGPHLSLDELSYSFSLEHFCRKEHFVLKMLIFPRKFHNNYFF
jgi:hypothetical protein